MGVALGLGAALCWGLADYFAALASRSIGALRVVLGFHAVALLPLGALVLATDGLARVDAAQVWILVLVGAMGWLSYLAFYAALAIGPISVLSPIVSGYAAVTAVLAVLFTGSRLSALQAVSVAITIAGAMFASADVRELLRTRIRERSTLGVVLALCAMALLGAFVFGVSYYRVRIGWLAPIFLARGFAALFLLGHVLVDGRRRHVAGSRRHVAGSREPGFGDLGAGEPGLGDLDAGQPAPVGGSPKRHRVNLALIIALLAGLDTGGYVCFNLGVGHAATAIVAAASAPYALVPILMGVAILGERPTRSQWAGVGLVIAGVITLGAVT